MHFFIRLKLFSRSHRLQHSFLALALAVLPSVVMAQSESDAGEVNEELTETTLEEVVVSASRVPVPAQHVGSSVTVFDDSDIETRQATHVHELLREVPGIAISQQSFSGQTQLRIRGSEANHSLVLFDGIELSDPLSSDEFYLQHLPVFATGRVEVLRGAQSSLYGSEAIGGVINVTSPRPEEGTTARLRVTQGSYNTSKVNSYAAISSGEYYSSLAVNYIKSKGISAKADNTEKDGMQQTNAHLKMVGQFADQFSIAATVLLLNFDGDYDGCSWPSSNDCKGRDKKRAIGVEMNYEQLDGDLVHTFKVNKVRHERREIIKGVPESGSPKLGKKSKIEYQASVNWNAGDTNQTTILAVNEEKNKATGPYVAGGKGGKFDTKSLVLEQRIDFGNDVFASLSARYDDNKNDQFKNYKTYRGTLAWVINESARIHTSAGTGVKNPTVSELFGWSTDWIANPELEPETSKSWDLGVEYRPAFADLTVDATYFVNKVTKLISSTCGANCDDNDYFNNISKSINNTGVSTIKGWELSLLGSVADNYDVSASATFLRGFDPNGKELIRRPSQIMSLNVSSENIYFGKPATSNLNIQHVGKQLDFTTWPSVGDLPEYTLVNVGTHVELNSDLELTAKIDNLFDKKYSEIRGYNKPGRSISIGMQYTF